MKRPAAVLFDLDGTLVDTAPDLATATNLLRAHHELPPLEEDIIRREVSHGGSALVTLALGHDQHHPEHDVARQFLLDSYECNVAERSRLFDGFETLINYFKVHDLPWGIITNKPRRYTEPLIKGLGLTPDVLLCADDLPVRKPDPAPLLEAARRLGVAPDECWYLGDHARDMEAARRAGMRSIAVGYGYIREGDDATQWGADLVLDHPSDVVDLFINK
ncbi:HAD-IA family hydrolase [Larsenimonas rhizosphaerae]|uniref:HAD-IA family hydrolase n=1 Tax=Larsenimonas rhizosphaerae TaxID=2944682 RepID=A0AA41ZDL5_9GAMM|nr:HAD-IA family hydrolase [Larsenimonas rhizosphaerae]MCM2130678.1 HAD-IA family hydrolase [Larsenimonas rhizosphaerae]MCX2523382.1 HAD-IA family hydrolase [Larsenimonas rhizosphaerae]